nr:MAG TPA: Terminase large subunit [Caudoviricetes sp.]
MARSSKNRKQNSIDKTKQGFKKWTHFYRTNPHRFAYDYLGIRLFLYQKLLLWAMNKYAFFMYIAARGQGSIDKKTLPTSRETLWCNWAKSVKSHR